jgi:hypothetical protein
MRLDCGQLATALSARLTEIYVLARERKLSDARYANPVSG